MKKHRIYFLFILFLLANTISYSQDIVILKDNADTIYCTIVEDHITSLDFYLYNSEDTTFYNIKADEIEGYILESSINDEENTERLNFEKFVKNIEKDIEPDTISLRTDWEIISNYRGGALIFIRHRFYSNTISPMRVGFGGCKLRPYIESSTESLAYLDNYRKTRYTGFIVMWGVPMMSLSLMTSSNFDESAGVSIILISHIVGKIIYHVIAPQYLKKSVGSYNKYLRTHPNHIKIP